MIHIDRNTQTPPDEIQEKEFKELAKKLLIEKSKNNFKKLSKYLKRFYNKKCGYCETSFKIESSLSMDHYRPKGKLIGEDHPGYYWLEYEYTNLLPACFGCNHVKSSHFPIDKSKGKRVTQPPMRNNCLDMEACRVNSEIHIAEKPLLLHPEVDKPEEHLIFLPTGEVNGITTKGETSVRIYKLNRDELITARKVAIDELFRTVIVPLGQFWKKEITKEILFHDLNKELIKIKVAGNPQNEYSRLGWFLFEEFEIFFIQKLRKDGKTESAQILEKAFSLFCEKGTCEIN